MTCEKPINETRRISFNLKERTPYDPTTRMLNPNRTPLDLTGYTFESRFLSKDPDTDPIGADILDEADVTILGDPIDGIYKEFLDEPENDALMNMPAVLEIAAQPDPKDRFIFWEFFAIKDGVRHRWFIADVGLEYSA